MNCSLESDKFAEHIVIKAKANIKTKRKRRKRQSPPRLQTTTAPAMHNQSRSKQFASTPTLKSQNSSSSSDQHQTQPSEQSLTTSGPARYSISRDQDLVKQLYYSPLYQQVRREWRDTLVHKQQQTQKASNAKRALTFDVEESKTSTPIIDRRKAQHNLINNHTSSFTTIASRAHIYSTLPARTKPTLSMYESKDHHQTNTDHDRRKEDTAMKTKQRSEVNMCTVKPLLTSIAILDICSECTNETVGGRKFQKFYFWNRKSIITGTF